MKYVVYFCIVVLIWAVPTPNYRLNCDDFNIVRVDFTYLRFLQKTGITHAIPLMLTVSPHVFVQSSYVMTQADLLHESTHIMQQKREGIFFYIKYLGYYAYNYVTLLLTQNQTTEETARQAYLAIPYEQEAYLIQRHKIILDPKCRSKLKT